MNTVPRSKAIKFYLAICFLASIVFAADARAGVNNWTVRSNPSTGYILGVAYGNGIYETAGWYDTLMSSLDGATWSVEYSGGSNHLLDLIYANNTFVAVGAHVTTSTDGQTWSAPTTLSHTLRGITYGNSKFVAVGLTGYTATSTDGETWIFNTAVPNSPNFNSVTYGDGIFVAVGSGTDSAIYSSLDGITWTPETISPTPPSITLNDVAYGNGIFIAVGNPGAICTSFDGQNWTYESVGANERFQSIAYGDGYFVAADYNINTGDKLYASQDTINWSVVCSAPSGGNFKRVRFTNESFIAVGFYLSNNAGFILQSQSGMSNNAFLSNVSLSSGSLSPAFSPNVASYTASVSSAVTSITVSLCEQNAHATATVNGAAVQCGVPSGPISLQVGSNEIAIAVTAQDGTIKNYTITVTRAASDSTNNKLDSLSLSNGILSPTFSPSITSYTAQVANSVSSITVTPMVQDISATVTVNGASVTSGSPSGSIALTVGSNTITVAVTAQNSTVNNYTVLVTRLPSSNAYLSDLSLSSGTLTPAFYSSVMSYTASVGNSVSSINVTPTVQDTTASVTVNGTSVASGTPSTIMLSVGSNTITVAVTAQDGTTINSYTVAVTRAASSNADLSNLSISSGTLTPAFSSSVTSYTDSVAYTVASMTVTPTVADATASITVNGSAVTSGTSGTILLSVGSNPINVVVTAQDGATIKTYAIDVTRAAPSTNADLFSMTVSQGTLNPVFTAGTTIYSDSVAYTITSMTVTPTVSESHATITVNGTPVNSGEASGTISLIVGSNTIPVVVTAQDGTTTKNYTINVTRAAPSTNADLFSLTVNQGILNPVFDADTPSYTISVAYTVTDMTVTPTADDATATITVKGTSVVSGATSGAIPLNVGSNTINVVVTAQDGTTIKTYAIDVTRAAPSSNANLSDMTVSQGTLAPPFDAGTPSYSESVDNAVTSMTVTPTAADTTATITVNLAAVTTGTASGDITLEVGSNTINVVVTAQDGTTTKTYTIDVIRAAL